MPRHRRREGRRAAGEGSECRAYQSNQPLSRRPLPPFDWHTGPRRVTKEIAGSLTPGSGAVTLAVMRNNDGRKLDHQTLEVLRLRATEQVAVGVPATEVGQGLAALGPHPKTIYTWLATERAEGRQALRAKPVPGRRRKLTDAQL